MERASLQDAVESWLADGPLTVEDLAARAVEAGLAAAGEDVDGYEAVDAIEDLLATSDAFWPIHSSGPDGDEDRDTVVVLVRTFTDTGMTFTHRLTDDEIAAEAVAQTPDLSVIEWNHYDGLALDDGSGTVAVDWSEPRAPILVGPPGWIEACHPGHVLAFRRTNSVLSVEVIDEQEMGDGTAELEALRAAATNWIGHGRGEEEVPVLMEAMARDPQLFRSPVPPVGELLVALGLEQRGLEWGWADEAWQTHQEQPADQAVRELYGFDPCCDQAFDRVAEAYRNHLDDVAVDGETLAKDLAHGSVTAAFVAADSTTPSMVVDFARAAGEAVTGRRRAPVATLLALAELEAGDPLAAVDALEAALAADPNYAVAAGTLALLEMDRGNLSRAHTLAMRDSDDPELADWIDSERSKQAALRPSAGRNDPCPCGSGKKFKRCCAIGGPLTLAQRLPLILSRLTHFATGPDGHETRLGLALTASDASGGDLQQSLTRFMTDPFMLDVALHEGGLAERYLDQRRKLLLDDEAVLLDAIVDADHRLWEILTVDAGRSMDVRDTRSGEELTVQEHRGSIGRTAGELLLARAAEIDGQTMFLGVPVLVPLRDRARTLALLDDGADPHELAAWAGSLHRAPTMSNREGEDLILRRTTFAVSGDLDVAVAALDECYDRDDDELVWREMKVLDGGDNIVRGVLRLDGRELEVESNSEARQARLIETLDELIEGVIVDDDFIDDLDLDDGRDFGDDNLFEPADMPDHVRAQIEQRMTEYEQRWVDESIPALAGLTPRQALDDPTRREDLFALLRDMRATEPDASMVAMSADRIKALLGIGTD